MFYPKKVLEATLIAFILFFASFSYAGVYTIPNIPFLNTGKVEIYANGKLANFLVNSNAYNYAETFTGYRLSCGPTALLYAHNFHTFVREWKPDELSKSVEGVRAALDRQYKAMGLKVNSTTHFEQLSRLAQKNLGMEAKYNKKPIDNIHNELANNRIIVVNVRDKTPLNKLGMDHFITLLASYFHNSKQYMVYFDPWDGRIKSATFEDFKSSIGAQAMLRIVLE